MGVLQHTILDQMALAPVGRGMGRLQALLGAKQFSATLSGVTFRYGKGLRYIAVTLDVATDTYIVDFHHYSRAYAVLRHETFTDVYADDLAGLVRAQTGMDTHL